MTMTNRLPAVAAAALLALSIARFADIASAMPVADALVIKNAAALNVESVQWRHRGWRGGGWGVGAGLLSGRAPDLCARENISTAFPVRWAMIRMRYCACIFSIDLLSILSDVRGGTLFIVASRTP